MTPTVLAPRLNSVRTFVTAQVNARSVTRLTTPAAVETLRLGSAELDESFDALLIEEGIRRVAGRDLLDFETVDDFLRSLGD